MKHSLDVRIISNDKQALDGIMAALPGADDVRVWSEQYDAPTQSVDDNGDNVLSGMIRFNEDQDRADVSAAAEAVEGMFYLCEPGSYLTRSGACRELTAWKTTTTGSSRSWRRVSSIRWRSSQT